MKIFWKEQEMLLAINRHAKEFQADLATNLKWTRQIGYWNATEVFSWEILGSILVLSYPKNLRQILF